MIKVWDRATLTLQAALHAHTSFISEFDISKCNRYFASAGQDAKIIVWELATGKIAFRLKHHTKLINCVKFFAPPKTDPDSVQQQYLFTCSDDGTCRLFDFTPIYDKQIGDDFDHDDPLFSIELTSPEIRPGIRNKKLDSCLMNNQGLVMVGSSAADILIWRINYDHLYKRLPVSECVTFISQYKIPRQSCAKF